MRLDIQVLERILFYLKSPGIQKNLNIKLNGQSQRHGIYESNPQDLYHALLSCKTIFKPYENFLRKGNLLELFYIQVIKPPYYESRLIETESPEKFRKFVASAETQQYNSQTPRSPFGIELISESMGLLSFEHPNINENGLRDYLIDLLSQNCVKRVETFGFKNEKDQSEVDILRGLKNQFLGIINFYQSDTAQGCPLGSQKTNCHGSKGFWAMICHCKNNKFLVLYSVGGNVWDRNFACPRVAEVININHWFIRSIKPVFVVLLHETC